MSTKATIVSGLIVTILGGVAVEFVRKNFLPSHDEVKVQIDRAQDPDLSERIRELERDLTEEKEVRAEAEQKRRRVERRLEEDRRRAEPEFRTNRWPREQRQDSDLDAEALRQYLMRNDPNFRRSMRAKEIIDSLGR